MPLQLLVGAVVSIMGIAIHAVVTVITILTARAAGLAPGKRPRLIW